VLTIDRDAERRARQSALDAIKTASERNRLGQFATPDLLADDIMRHVATLLPADIPVRFMDPTIGLGSFYAAARRVLGSERIQSALGYEIDPEFAASARELWDGTPLEVRGGDFALARPIEQVMLLVANPPYVRHHHLDGDAKPRLRQLARAASGMDLSGLSGLYAYHIAVSHKWLAPGAVSAWLIPSEWMTVNYGREVQRYLLERVTLHRVHRFDPSDGQFGDAIVSSAVVSFSNIPPSSDHAVEFSYGGTIEAPRVSVMVPSRELRQTTKWTRYPHTSGLDNPRH